VKREYNDFSTTTTKTLKEDKIMSDEED